MTIDKEKTMKLQPRCELCGQFIEEDNYYSLHDCNETGIGVCVCESCCDKHDKLYFVGRKDGYLYGYLKENDGVAQWLGDEGTPIKMTMAVAEKLCGNLDDYILVEAK